MAKVKVLLLLLISILILSCGDKEESLKIGYIPIAECVPLYVAQEKGFFEELGVQIELVSLPGGANILNALNSGSVDIGFSNIVSLILQRSEGAKLFSIFGGSYENQKHQNHALLVRKRNNVKDPKLYLRNAKIAVNTFKNVEEMMVRKYIESIGLSWDSVKINLVQQGFPRMLPLLDAESIDAASIVEPFITLAKEDSTGSIINLANHYLTTTPRTLVATYASSETFIKSNPEIGDKFIQAMSKATKFIKENEVEAREIIGRYTKIPQNLFTKMGLSEFTDEIDLELLNLILADMKRFNYILPNKHIPTVQELVYKGVK